AAANELEAALHRIAKDGNDADRAIVAEVLKLHAAYVKATWHGMFPAVDAHNTALVLHYDHTIVDPTFSYIQNAVFSHAQTEQATAIQRLADLEQEQQRLLYAVPIIFGLGLVLLYTLWRVVWGQQRAADRLARNEALSEVE